MMEGCVSREHATCAHVYLNVLVGNSGAYVNVCSCQSLSICYRHTTRSREVDDDANGLFDDTCIITTLEICCSLSILETIEIG